MVLSIYVNLVKETPEHRFTVGIANNIVTHLPLRVGDWLELLGTIECMSRGLGDGTMAANTHTSETIALSMSKLTASMMRRSLLVQ